MLEAFIPNSVLLEKKIKNSHFYIINKKNLLEIVSFLKYNHFFQYKVLSDICIVDSLYSNIKSFFLTKGVVNKKNTFNRRFHTNERFEVIYNFLSILNHSRVFLKIYAMPSSSISSLCSLYSSSNWWERECWDMFGLYFKNHPDLRRILTDYGFEGFPLRKDFPLSGYVEVRYDELKKRIINEKLSLSQEYRYFDFINPWVL